MTFLGDFVCTRQPTPKPLFVSMNKYDPQIHHRRSIRLKDYDYSKEGLYFITICSQNRVNRFGKVSDLNAAMILNEAGQMIDSEWLALVNRFPNVRLHEHVVMPNHFHGIIEIIIAPLAETSRISENLVLVEERSIREREETQAETKKTIGDIIGAFKSITTAKYILGVKTLNWRPFNKKLWQRDYYEHIIRNEGELDRIANYILNNPAKWKEDKLR